MHLWEANEAWLDAYTMHRCDAEPCELHALVLQLFLGRKVELGEGVLLPILGRQMGLLCAECFPVHSRASQDLEEATHGLP